MEMVADMEERKTSSKSRLNNPSIERYSMNIDQISAGTVVRNKGVKREHQSKNKLRFTGPAEKRPKLIEVIGRTVEIGGDNSPREVVELKPKIIKDQTSISSKRESVDSLENDNGSDLMMTQMC